METILNIDNKSNKVFKRDIKKSRGITISNTLR